ncbi:MAG: hypothetical protein A2Z72_01675 [Omnitrophica bacterium RBG_13_46_9]|nr:MAG: hypothetical protein A2Z72_01675 [Omnitrophica bacterium RBG_13_46_9]
MINKWIDRPAKKLVFFISIFVFLTYSIFADVNKNAEKELSKQLVKLEGDLIIDCTKIDEIIYQRGAIYENEEITAYVNRIAKRVMDGVQIDDKTDIKIKIIRDPIVNAFALPNGSIYVHTGALARLENEAQLAFLLGHEISHVDKKDGVYHTHSTHKKTIAYKLVDIILAPTSVFFGILGDLTQFAFGILHVSTVTGYSRKIEARADTDSILWVTEKGYDPDEAQTLLEIFLKEKEKYQTGTEIYFLMNHPSNEWRLKNIKSAISKEYGDDVKGDVKEEEFLCKMTEVKLYNATLNMKMDRMEHAKDNIEWVLNKFPDNPHAHYLLGEVLRLEAEDKTKLKYELNQDKWKELEKKSKESSLEDGWYKEAMNEYEAALKCDPNYVDSYKGIGHLYYAKKDRENALTYFSRYLAICPDAKDKRYIESLIKRLNDNQKEL